MSLRRAAGPSRKTLWLWLRRGAIVAVVSLAATLLYRSLSRYDAGDLIASVLSVPVPGLLAAVAWAAASYLCLTGFDWLGLRYAGRRLAYRKVALASFVSLSLGHNIGFAGLSSGAIRYRYYSREGVTAVEVAKLVVFCGATVGLGLVTLAGVAMAVRPEEAEAVMRIGRSGLFALAAACLSVPLLYLGLAWMVRTPLRVHRWTVEMPSAKLALAQIVLGTTNFACVAACLHQVLEISSDVTYFATASVYVLANTAALISHVPGGLGVIESVTVYLVPGDDVLPMVLVFRFVYFLIPLSIGGTLFAATEIRRRAT